MPNGDSLRASLNSLCVTSGKRCVFGGCGRESEEAERIREQGSGSKDQGAEPAASRKVGEPSPAELVAVTQILAVGLLPAPAGRITSLATGPPPATLVALCLVYSLVPAPIL